MKAQIRIGRLFGIDIGLHYSWFIIAFLITLSLAGHFRVNNPDWEPNTAWISAILTGLLFFLAIIIHELAHALVARSRGIPVRSITLFALGGVASIEKESKDPKTEFWIGFVGPLASVVVGLFCLALARAFGWDPDDTAGTPAQAVLSWLGYINLGLALFNMIPGFPLDGGRVLRSIIWWITGDAARATRISARVGQGVAFALILVGIVQFFGGAGVGGIWLVFIGWFLLNAAGASYGQVEAVQRLQGIRVADIMTRQCPTVDSRMTLQQFVDESLLRTGQRSFVVVDGDAVVGLITPNEVKEVDRSQWRDTPVGQAMRPLHQLRTVTPGTPVSDALEIMSLDDVNQLPVLSGGRLLGTISRRDILRILRTREELEV
jgi:Zn-dependent protease/predicted transcriptional regulator